MTHYTSDQERGGPRPPRWLGRSNLGHCGRSRFETGTANPSQSGRVRVEVVADSSTALKKLRRRPPPSALILDLRDPGSSGYDLCREIAQSAPWVPFVILGVSSDVLDKIILLEIGADDYLAKPFVPRELAARLRALMRRVTLASRDFPYVFDDVTVDFSTMDVTRRGEKVLLTAQEF